MRLPDGMISRCKTDPTKEAYGKWTKIPLLRGVVAFIDSMVTGTKTLMDSAEMLEDGDEEDIRRKPLREAWLNKKFGAKGAWNLMIYFSVFLALVFHGGNIHHPADRRGEPDEACLPTACSGSTLQKAYFGSCSS